MRGFSLTQPWASAVMLGLKQWETRSWRTSYRGEVAIHAAKTFPKWCKNFAYEQDMPSSSLPLGQIICIATITDCQRTEDIRNLLPAEEITWGDYGDSRYALRLGKVIRLSPYIAFRGALGLWPISKDVLEIIRRSCELPA